MSLDRVFCKFWQSGRVPCWLATMLIAGAVAPPPGAWGQSAVEPNDTVEDFQLDDVHGVPHSLNQADDVRATVIVFMGWECPMAKLYVPRLNELQRRFSDEGVRWLAINSNQHDSLAELQAFVRRSELALPLLKDPGNRVADLFGATRTPEVFLLDARNRVRYHGQIDDQYAPGQQRPAATRHYLAAAIEQLLDGQQIAVAQTNPAGCLIGRVLTPNSETSDSVTYHNQISRILQDNCASCHRAGEIGPFELNTYEEVSGWAGMIQEVVNEGRMPPWHANPEHGSFRNDCRLASDEIEMINAWVQAGARRAIRPMRPNLGPGPAGGRWASRIWSWPWQIDRFGFPPRER